MSPDVFLSAGEASGDLQASLLVRELRKLRPELTFAAVGGERLRDAGAKIVQDCVAGEWASIGHLRAYLKIPWLLMIMLGLARRLLSDPPRLLICVDFGAFNLRMLEWLRFCGYRGKALYYFPPGVWFDNAGQARKVARVATALTPLRHQADFYRRLGLPVEYFGHPLAGAIQPRPNTPLARPPRIAIMPGSRDEEIALHVPILAEAARIVRAQTDARFTVVAASESRARELRAAWPAECGGPDAVVRLSVADAATAADLAWVASGTAVLETALAGVPQIAFYRLSEAQYRFTERRVPHIIHGPITLPNLVTGKTVVPELLQYDFEPRRVAAETATLLESDDARRAQIEGYAALRRALGPNDAIVRIAAYVETLLPKKTASP